MAGTELVGRVHCKGQCGSTTGTAAGRGSCAWILAVSAGSHPPPVSCLTSVPLGSLGTSVAIQLWSVPFLLQMWNKLSCSCHDLTWWHPGRSHSYGQGQLFPNAHLPCRELQMDLRTPESEGQFFTQHKCSTPCLGFGHQLHRDARALLLVVQWERPPCRSCSFYLGTGILRLSHKGLEAWRQAPSSTQLRSCVPAAPWGTESERRHLKLDPAVLGVGMVCKESGGAWSSLLGWLGFGSLSPLAPQMVALLTPQIFSM